MLPSGKTTYQQQVLDQMYSFVKQCGGNPLTFPVFHISGEKIPLWKQSHKEKALSKPEAVPFFLYDNTYLIQRNVPRQFCSIRIEREMMFDVFEEFALVERQYYIPYSTLKIQEELVVVTTITVAQSLAGPVPNTLYVFSHSPGEKFGRGRHISEANPLKFLNAPFSLT